MTRTRCALLGALMLTLAAGDLPAQQAASYGRPFAGALLGGAAGVLAGGLAGLYVGGNRCSEPANSDTCQGLEGLVVGAGLGATLGAPLGAHLMNGRRGSLPLSMLGSAVVGGVGVLAILAIERNVEPARQGGIQVPLALAMPVAQVITAALIERGTSRR